MTTSIVAPANTGTGTAGIATPPLKAEEPKKLILSVEQMLSADDTEFAVIPTWKIKGADGKEVQGYTRIGSLNADDIIEWRESNDGKAKRTMGVRIFVNSLVDEAGNRIGNPTLYEAFRKKSNAVQERVLAHIVQMNGLSIKNEQQTCPTCKTRFPVQTGGDTEAKND